MGLAYDPNDVLPIPNLKRDLLEEAKQKSMLSDSQNDSEDDDIDMENKPAKIHVAQALEIDAKTPRKRMFRLPNGQVNFITYLLDKYGEDYKVCITSFQMFIRICYKI